MSGLIKERVKEKRIELGLTQLELANKLGVAHQTVSKYEKGIVTNITLPALQDLARALNTTQAYLIGWEDNSKDKNSDIANIVANLRSNDKYFELCAQLLNVDESKLDLVSQLISQMK